MNDVDDAFAGILADDWLLAPATDFPAIQLLLDFLGRFTHSPAEHSVMGSAIKTAGGALAFTGGHVIAVEVSPPLLGMGRVSSSEIGAFYGTEEESQLCAI